MALSFSENEIYEDGRIYPAKRIRHADSVTAAKALPNLSDEEVVVVKGIGLYRYDVSSTATPDDLSVLEYVVGRLLLVALRPGHFYVANIKLFGQGSELTAEIANTTGETPVLARTGVGVHTLTWATATPWTAGKTAMFSSFIEGSELDGGQVRMAVTSSSVLTITTESALGAKVDNLTMIFFKAEVYP